MVVDGSGLAVDEYLYFTPKRPMTRGRPPNWQVFSQLDGSVWTQPVIIASRQRLTLPAQVRARLAWLSQSEDGLLATLGADGSVRLEDWESHGERTLRAAEEVYEGLPAARKGEFALAAMDRFMKVGLEPNGRLVLPDALMAQIDPAETGCVRVVVIDGLLWLWEEKAWLAQRSARIALLQDVISS